jgi:hypothetical protein
MLDTHLLIDGLDYASNQILSSCSWAPYIEAKLNAILDHKVLKLI